MNVEDMFCPCCGVLRLEGKEILRKTLDLESKWEAYWHNKGRTFVAPLLEVSSGYRCAKHNPKVGGSATSQHLRSRAIDIRKKDRSRLTAEEAGILWWLAEKVGFTGIILYSHHIHVDTRIGAPYKRNKWER